MSLQYFNRLTRVQVLKPGPGLVRISSANLQFFSGLSRGLEEFHRSVFPAVSQLTQNSPITLDNFYVATDGRLTYSQLKSYASTMGSVIQKEVDFKERRLCILQLKTPFTIGDFDVNYVGIGEPKPGSPESNHIAHISYLLGGDDVERRFADIMQRIKTKGRINFENSSVEFIKEDYWRNELVGFKCNVFVGGKAHQVQIRRVPIQPSRYYFPISIESTLERISAISGWRERYEVAFSKGMELLNATSGSLYFMRVGNGDEIGVVWRGSISSGDRITLEIYEDSWHREGTKIKDLPPDDVLALAMRDSVVVVSDSSKDTRINKPDDKQNPKSLVFIPVSIPGEGVVVFKFQKSINDPFAPRDRSIRKFKLILDRFAPNIIHKGKKVGIMLETVETTVISGGREITRGIIIRYSHDYGQFVRDVLKEIVSNASEKLRVQGTEEVVFVFGPDVEITITKDTLNRQKIIIKAPTPPDDSSALKEYFSRLSQIDF